MPAPRIHPPGTDLGPCDEPCEHQDCADQHAIAAEICRYCDQPIGFDTRFYPEADLRAAGTGITYHHVHAICQADAFEEERRNSDRARFEQRAIAQGVMR